MRGGRKWYRKFKPFQRTRQLAPVVLKKRFGYFVCFFFFKWCFIIRSLEFELIGPFSSDFEKYGTDLYITG